MGTTAPYGYVKDPADHNHLLIDDKVAHVVREIFDLALAGNGIAKIRKHINKQHILRPAAYAAEQGATGYERYFEENEENRYIWSENSVRGILRSPIYAGNLAGYKRIAANMKSKKRPSKLPEEWEVIPDTHEGIVTQEEFDTVQQLITSRRLPENKGGFENIFAGVIKCADCGYAMRAMSANRRKRPDIIDCVQYSCNNYGRYGNIMCTAHSIEARDLFNAVLTDINRFADMAVNDEKAVRAIEKRLTETDQSKAKALEKEQRKLNKRLAELDRLFSSLYEDKVMERITERNFEMMSGKYQKEQLEIEARLKEVTETLSDSYEKTQGVRDFLSLIRNYQGIKELDATIINALIDKILVSEREKLTDGMVRQEIKIYYKFIGFVGELHITPTKRWTALKPKNCTVCGVEYVPRSGISKYCPACAKKIQREKSNESKRRSRERNRQACIELSAKNDRLKKDRDRFILSAGHKCMAQYAVLAERGYFDKEILDTYGRLGSHIPGHPDMHKLPGIEANTGALGHGLAIGTGMALALRLDGLKSRVYVMMGDGELAEGSNWEAAAAAAHYKLDNLTLFIDFNGLQISGAVNEVMNFTPIGERFRAFGWNVKEIDGNNMEEIVDLLNRIPDEAGKPVLAVLHTVKGKGISFAEGKAEYHYWTPGKGELEAAAAEIEGRISLLSEKQKGGSL
ncbi:tnpX site-specific recombinase [Hungatella hathewayi CAG:224]|nr:tnpX site-specific recombinase [Hungatella hathewayi CAG:224]